MERLIGVAFCICLLSAVVPAQQASSPLIMEPERFDQWGDLRLNDENTRLYRVAIQAKEWPLSIVHLSIHAGQTACTGEAKARGIRAKNYLTTLKQRDYL